MSQSITEQPEFCTDDVVVVLSVVVVVSVLVVSVVGFGGTETHSGYEYNIVPEYLFRLDEELDHVPIVARLSSWYRIRPTSDCLAR